MSEAHAHAGTCPIHVAGDVTIDWMLVMPSVAASTTLHASYQWESRAAVQIVAQPGGAALLHRLIAASDSAPTTLGTMLPPEALQQPGEDAVTRTYTVWKPYPVQHGARELVWRMDEFLGMQPGTGPLSRAVGGQEVERDAVVVIDDANLGFRGQPDAWPEVLRAGTGPRHVILKMSGPLGFGLLWERLLAALAERLTLYCSVGDLRKEYAPVGQSLSWERIASDVVLAVRGRADLRRAARVIVSLGMSGAVWVERDGPATLLYDPLHQEGDWERSRPGSPVGLGTCMTAALAITAAQAGADEQPDWCGALRAGLVAGRTLHEQRRVTGSNAAAGLHFPCDTIGPLLSKRGADTCFQQVRVPDEADWRIFATVTAGDYRARAERIVLEGDAAACRDLPVERIGAWASIDRTEIESMRSVRNIMREYLAHSRRARPLSLAVFGPPGSGKSFAIKQMAREWIEGPARLRVLEMNLSQFASLADLPAALQRVRDCAVEGALPLVFWDEFDTQLGGREMGWLAQFLAPMQDGVFLEDGVLRPIGPAIFIFAGGTHPTMASFKERAVQLPGAKATDFLSRLRGYVDILGPNTTDEQDQTAVLRRALLLRALLHSKAPGLVRGGRLDIDPGVLRAFLDVPTYVHGARSVESVIDMSALTGRLRFERSALPPRHQLSLHVDADQFLRLVERP
jgi:hypothetical protein